MSDALPTPAVVGLKPAASLNYANTLGWRGRETPTENLRELPDVVRWVGGNAGIGVPAVEAWLHWAGRDEAGARHLFEQAIALREAMYRIFSAVASGSGAPDSDVAILNAALAEAPPRSHLQKLEGAEHYGWKFAAQARTAPVLLAPVLWSAADLLAQANPRIRQCANEECLWLFIDESKSGKRRWCDMAACGNRAKARRHYLKHKKV